MVLDSSSLMSEQGLVTPISILLALAVFIGLFLYLRNRKSRLSGRAIRPEHTSEKLRNIPTTITPVPSNLTDEDRVKKGLGKTKSFFLSAIDRVLAGGEGDKFYDDVEEALLTADVGIEYTDVVLKKMKAQWGVKVPVRNELKSGLGKILQSTLPQDREFITNDSPHVVMIVGVNGAGKTTTIAKLCQRFKSNGKKVIVGAADTFRAAATEQLKSWIDRIGVDGVFQAEGSDPSAVAFDTVQAALSRKSDVCIVDTAGRLHTKANLMDELKKMKRVVTKALPSAPHDIWLVIDGTMGQNAFNQAKEFHESLTLTGLIVTKLDGSSKGGSIFSISSQLGIPVIFIGVGETPEDLVPFKSSTFVDAVLSDL